MKRNLVAISFLILAALACTRGSIDIVGRVTPVGTAFATPTLRPVPTLVRSVATPEPVQGPTPTRPPIAEDVPLVYVVQAGDSLALIADRFDVPKESLISLNALEPGEELETDDVIYIPARLSGNGPSFRIVPNSEMVYSLGVIGFDTEVFVQSQGGYLSQYREFVQGVTRTGGEIVQRVADQHSVSPRMLLAIIEYQSGWVSNPNTPSDLVNPLGYKSDRRQGFFQQLDWAADTLNLGYYRWRDASLQALELRDAQQIRIAPTLNAGTVAVQYFFSQIHERPGWEAAVGENGVFATFLSMLGDPFEDAIEPLIPPGLGQPELQLPFLPDRKWLYVSGPHPAWQSGSPWAALDFAPPSLESGCVESDEWVTAPAPGLVVQSGSGILMLDLDGDGHHQSGWVLFMLHMETDELVPVGRFVETGDLLGHPSCEGGRSLGTHMHFARKYNGEWVPAEGEVPLVLGAWTAHFGERIYKGTLTNGAQSIRACECSSEVAGIWIGRAQEEANSE